MAGYPPQSPAAPPYYPPQQFAQPVKRPWGTGKTVAVVAAILGGLCLVGCLGAGIIGAVTGDDKPAAVSTTRPVVQPTQVRTTAPSPTTASVAPTTAAPAATTAAPPPGIRTEGILLVPGEVAPGTYRATVPSGEHCYWARLRGTTGEFAEIIANGNGDSGERVTVTVKASDKALEQHGCGDWLKIG